jgi:hypothetical protein
MVSSTAELALTEMRTSHPAAAALLRSVVIGMTAFLTAVDLFATQAILPSLVNAYGVSPAAMGVAVNASTIDRLVGRRRLQRQDQSPALHSFQPCALVDPNRTARRGA